MSINNNVRDRRHKLSVGAHSYVNISIELLLYYNIQNYLFRTNTGMTPGHVLKVLVLYT